MKEKENQNQSDHQPATDKKGQETPNWIAWVLALVVIVGIIIAVKVIVFSPDKETLDPTVVIVNNEKLHKSYIDKKYNELGPELAKEIPYEEFIDQLIDQRILIQEAKRLKISLDAQHVLDEYDLILQEDQTTRGEFRTSLIERNLTEDDILSTINNNLLIEKLIENVVIKRVNVSEEELKKLYELNIDRFKVKEAVHASHILVNDVEDAISLKKQLDGGAEFTQLAMEHSIDPTVEENKGDLGYFEREMMVKEFSDVAFAQNIDTISDPVKTNFGWHIINVHDHKQDTQLSFSEVRELLEQNLLNEKLKVATGEYINILKEKAKIEKITEPQQ